MSLDQLVSDIVGSALVQSAALSRCVRAAAASDLYGEDESGVVLQTAPIPSLFLFS